MSGVTSRARPRLSGFRALTARLLARPVLDAAALLFSLVMLVSLLPSISIPTVVQIAYYLVVPGYALLGLVNRPMGILDRIALMLGISLGMTAGFAALFQSFYPQGSVNQSLAIPLVTLAASAISFQASRRKPK